jgi:hypothetical protein
MLRQILVGIGAWLLAGAVALALWVRAKGGPR